MQEIWCYVITTLSFTQRVWLNRTDKQFMSSVLKQSSRHTAANVTHGEGSWAHSASSMWARITRWGQESLNLSSACFGRRSCWHSSCYRQDIWHQRTAYIRHSWLTPQRMERTKEGGIRHLPEMSISEHSPPVCHSPSPFPSKGQLRNDLSPTPIFSPYNPIKRSALSHWTIGTRNRSMKYSAQLWPSLCKPLTNSISHLTLIVWGNCVWSKYTYGHQTNAQPKLSWGVISATREQLLRCRFPQRIWW